MKEYNYSRQLINGLYTIGYSIKDEIEEISLAKEIIEVISNKTIVHVICNDLDVKIIIEPELTLEEENLLDLIIQNHK
jgi:radical SAM superfamily enzyme